jgi:MarR family transcriptional regulator for hemolysin
MSKDAYTERMPHTNRAPIGLQLNQAARVVGQQFDRALTEAGGSLPIWLVLLSLAGGTPANQRALANVVGLSEASLSHHLNAMERQGLVTRTRNETNRRIHDVAVTDDGKKLFRQLRTAAEAFDARLNDGLAPEDQAHLATLLDHLVSNISDTPRPVPPWAGIGPTALAARRPTAPAVTAETGNERN